MTLIAGASRFLSTSTLASSQGSTFQAPSVLGTSTAGTANLLDVGRRNSSGIGLSSNARVLNRQLIDTNTSLYNGLFSLAGGGSATVDSARTQILGLRASVPASRDVADLTQDTGGVAESSLGSEVDESV